MIAARSFKPAFACTAALVIGSIVPAGGGFAQDVSINGIWIADGSRSQRMPQNPPYTEEGRSIVSQWQSTHDPVEDDPGRYCQSPGMPSIALSGAGYPVEIAVTPSQVFILLESHQQVRRVFLDQEHPERPFPQRNGHSVGQWEGEALVVDTIGIRPITFGSVPHSGEMHVVERFSVIDGGESLVVEVTIDDPVFYREPIVVERYFTAAPDDTRMLEYECSEAMWIEHQESRGLAAF